MSGWPANDTSTSNSGMFISGNLSDPLNKCKRELWAYTGLSAMVL
jgi:hypothetical protein